MKRSKGELKLAEQQLTGYVHAARGYSLRDLVINMGMTKQEWEKLRESEIVKNILSSSEFFELDDMFHVESSTPDEDEDQGGDFL